MASEKMPFDNVDEGQWVMDAWLYYKLTYAYEPLAQVS